MNRVAESYVELVLALGMHDGDYVDAYYGPPHVRQGVEAESLSLDAIRERAVQLIAQLRREPAANTEGVVKLRYDYLATQLRSLVARLDLLGGRTMSFDEESRLLYDAVAPRRDLEEFDQVLGELDEHLPGAGAVSERLDLFRNAYIVPSDRLERVFEAAIAECRTRSMRYVTLPDNETFVVEYVTDKPWSGYNWYQGNFRSVIQVNTDLPVYIDRALDLACHEGYPGHHVYNVLLEKHLTRDRGWVEYTVYPLFSPQSLIAEGTANLGIDLAFPGNERIQFERDVLYPLAGLDSSTAEAYARVGQLVEKLEYAGNEAARRYLDGDIDAGAAADILTRYSLMSPERARQRIAFIERYRSYVINYNVGLDIVRNYVFRSDESGVDSEWERFLDLLSTPRVPSGLTVN